MSYEQAKEFLKSYQNAKADADRIELLLSAITLEKASVDCTEEGKLEKELKSARKKAFAEMLHVAQIIERLEDPMEKRLLESKYISGISNLKIASELGYSERQILRIQSSGILHISLILGKS